MSLRNPDPKPPVVPKARDVVLQPGDIVAVPDEDGRVDKMAKLLMIAHETKDPAIREGALYVLERMKNPFYAITVSSAK